MNNKFLLIGIGVIIAITFALELLLPSISPYYVLAIVVVFAGGLFFVNNQRNKRKEIIVTDERSNSIIAKAANYTFRITYSLFLVVGIVLTFITTEIAEFRIIGLVLISVSIFQTVLFNLSYMLIERKN